MVQFIINNFSPFLLMCAAIFNMCLMHKLNEDRRRVLIIKTELEQLLKLNKYAYEEVKKKDNSMRSQVKVTYGGGIGVSDDAAAIAEALPVMGETVRTWRLANPNPNPPSNMLRSLDDSLNDREEAKRQVEENIRNLKW